MRGRALFGGAAILAAVALWHRPAAEGAGQVASGSRCEQSGAGPLCDAVLGLAKTLHNPVASLSGVGRLPPPGVPGETDPRVTQANIGETICRPGYSRAARPAYAVTGPLKRRMMDSQHPGEPMSAYELDHLIPISLGGAPLDARDLWLQPREGQANAGDKNVLAYVLWRLVCERRVPLEVAQTAISRDWTKAYETYATPENVARYHFRHREEGRDRPDPATPE